MTEGDSHTVDGKPGFKGYPAPTSNTTYTPNQLFDVVLRRNSRGCVRLVSYMIRKTLGWSDAEGNPQEPQVVIAYNQLIRDAGISRGAISPTLDEAISANYIRCIRQGQPSSHRKSAVSALYELCWDDRDEYVKDPAEFQGFFSGNGNLTYIPNAFFDYTVPNEPLAVVKVVGAIIRYTIGFQTKFGFRRQQIDLSFTRLQRITGISSRRSLNDAIQQAMANNHIVRLNEGYFDADAGRQSRAATYGIKWCDTSSYPAIGSKRIPEYSETEPAMAEIAVQKGYRDTQELPVQKSNRKITGATNRHQSGPVQKGHSDQFKIPPPAQSKKDGGGGSGTAPEAVQEGHSERFKNGTDIEITPINKTTKQQQQSAAAAEVFLRLMNEGFDKSTATALVKTYPPHQIIVQCDCLPKRNPSRNRLGMLRKSIEENWPTPEAEAMERQGAIFASHFYAAWAGNREEPAAPAIASDIDAAEQYTAQLLRHYPREDKLPSMARSFGDYVREQERGNPNMPRSLKLALTRHGDEFFIHFKRKVEAWKKKRIEKAHRAHYDQHRDSYFEFLREAEERIRNEQPLMYNAFESDEAQRRQFLVDSPYCSSEELRGDMLRSFDSPGEHIKRFREFFQDSEDVALDFWKWDKQINPNGFGQEAASA
ncbi:hypothetical protein GC163_24300 [bacterium]|nr:hypothetical protein [bacterium]